MKKRILIVDDNAIQNIETCRVLNSNGYTAESVVSGERCLQYLHGGAAPDLILMDIDLGRNVMDGTETTRKIYEKFDIPVVFYSAHTEREIIEKTKNITKYGYIQKTIKNTHFLLATLELALQLHSTERELKKSEARYKALFEHTNNAVVVYRVVDRGKDFIIEDINSAALKNDGLVLSECKGKSVMEIKPVLKDAGLIDLFRKVYRTGESVNVPPFYLEDAKTGGFYTSYIYRLQEDIVVEVFNDITEEIQLKQKNQKYIHAFDNSENILAIIGRDYRYTAVNRKYCEYNNIREEEIIGRTVEDLLGVESFRYLKPSIDETFQGKITSLEFEKVYPRLGKRYLLIKNVPLRGSGGEIEGVFASNIDITELKRKEEILLKMRPKGC